MLQLKKANNELDRISKEVPSGMGIWTQQKRYICGLEFLLDKESD